LTTQQAETQHARKGLAMEIGFWALGVFLIGFGLWFLLFVAHPVKEMYGIHDVPVSIGIGNAIAGTISIVSGVASFIKAVALRKQHLGTKI
jgi:hypothetical protein